VKLYSHVVKHDTGLAPNPFHGFCTSAVCTPSHAKARLKVGDWLIGNSQKKDGHRLVYAMQLCDVLSMNEYFQDSRFQNKKPKLDGAPEEQCGDNFTIKTRMLNGNDCRLASIMITLLLWQMWGKILRDDPFSRQSTSITLDADEC